MDLAPFAEQAFHKLYLWALTQIVGGCLETQPQYGDFLFPGVQNHLHCALEVFLIAGNNGVEERQLKIEFLGAVVQGTHVLG